MPQIDLSHYRSKLQDAPEYARLLEESESRLKAFAPTKIDVQSQLALLEGERQRKLKEADAYLQRLETELGKLRDQVHKLQNAKPADEMTVDDVYALYPELKERVYNNIKNDNWSTTSDDPQHDDHAHKH